MRKFYILLLALVIPCVGNSQNVIDKLYRFSYSYEETVNEEIFTYEDRMEAEYLSFDFTIRILELDTLTQYASLEFIVDKVNENERKGFEVLEQFVGEPFQFDYYHNYEVEWPKSPVDLSKISKKLDVNYGQVKNIKEGLERLLLEEFGLLDGIFLPINYPTEGISIFCDDEYNFDYKITKEIEMKVLTIVEKYKQKTIERHFKSKIEERIKNTIELNREKFGPDSDLAFLDEHINLRRKTLDQILDQLEFAEIKIVQNYKNEVLPENSNARFFNFRNICEGERLSLFFDVFIQSLDN